LCLAAVASHHKQVRTVGAMSDDLEKLSDWLTEHGVRHVAMESTGSYWKPAFTWSSRRRTIGY